MNRVAALRMRHQVESATIQFRHDALVFARLINDRWRETRAAIGEELDEVGVYPFIVITRTGCFEIGQETFGESVRIGDGTKGRARSQGEASRIAQLSV